MTPYADDTYFEQSDNDVSPAEHSKLLTAIAQLDGKQRVKPPSRKEPSLQVSEFHLVQGGIDENAVQIQDLAKVLENRASHTEIGQKLRAVKNKTRTLPKPLEKVAAERIQREVGYAQVKKQVSRWDAIVESNRVAEQLVFPLNGSSLRIVNNTEEFVSRFQTKSPLEAQMAEILASSKAVEEEKEDKEQKYLLSLEELMERRKEMAHLRAQQSYQEAKARRLKKIKSKKYHRIQRRERTRKQLKDFEILQKTDPEAALKQLELLERTRAEERMTLRHRSTGQWARSRAVRAKYDMQSRQELAEQLAVSRDLTKKVKPKESSDEDEEEEKEEIDLEIPSNTDNPWMSNKTQNEVETFVSGYRKYWDERHKAEAAAAARLNGNSESCDISQPELQDKQPEDNVVDGTDNIHKKKQAPIKNSEINRDLTKNQCKTAISSSQDKPIKKFAQAKKHQIKTQPITDKKIEKAQSKPNKQVKKMQSNNNVHSQNKISVSQVNSSNSKMQKVVESQLESKSGAVKRKKKNVVEELTTSNKISKIEMSPGTVMGTSNTWIVTPIITRNKAGTRVKRTKKDIRSKTLLNDKKKRKAKSKERENNIQIDDVFDEMEKKMKRTVAKKLEKLKRDMNIVEDDVQDLQEEDTEGPSLKMKKSVRHPMEDEELVEESGRTTNYAKSNELDLNGIRKMASLQNDSIGGSDRLGKVVGQKNTASTPGQLDVDPNKFMAVKPRRLKTQLPDSVTGGEEGLDDEDEEDQRLTISEAFADDDVVADFRKEKEETLEKLQPKDLDLTLPGWGSWGGKNLPVPKRKKRPFIIKFPKVTPHKAQNKGNVILNETKNTKVKEHQVSELPYPFTSVKDFEASIRAPISSSFIPETAHRRFIKPPVVTKLGTVIEPMDEEMLVNKKNKLAFV